MMLFGRSITAWIVRILVILKLVPRGKSKLEDWCGFLFWLITQTALTVIFLCQIGDTTRARLERVNIAGIINIAAGYLPSLYHNIGVAWSLTKPWQKIDLTKNRQLKAPTALPLLLVIAGLQGLNIYYAFQAIFQKSNLGAMMPFISLAILSFISVFVIGIFCICFRGNFRCWKTTNCTKISHSSRRVRKIKIERLKRFPFFTFVCHSSYKWGSCLVTLTQIIYQLQTLTVPKNVVCVPFHVKYNLNMRDCQQMLPSI